MSQTLQVELTEEQREVLLRGLRYVRSSLMLEFREPAEDDAEGRQRQLLAIASLVQQLNSAPAAPAPA
jgi:hypothetical protein